MADTKITALTALTAADPINDVIPIVDVSDTSMAASGTTKKISVNNILSSSPTASGALTVTGLVTAGSATITGAATVGTTLGVTGALSAASLALSGAGAGFTATATSGNSLNQIQRPTNATAGGIQFKTSSTNDWIMGLRETGDSDFHLLSYGTVADVLTVARATGNVTVSAGNVVMGTSGKGIDFAATAEGSGTMTSELLNDYEEGTFTPTVVGATIAGVGTYTQNAGFYTKVGNLVTASVFLGWTAHTGTGIMYFGGLPFTTSSGFNSYGAASISYVNNITLTASNVMNLLVPPAQSFLESYQYPVGGGAATVVPIDVAGSIIYTVTYRV